MKLKEEVLDLCRSVAGSRRIAGAFICGDYALGVCGVKTLLEVLVVVHNFQPRFINHVKLLNRRLVLLNLVDKWVFERDVEGGFLGDALAFHMAFPYIPLIGKEYLAEQEIRLKERFIRELLENLVLDFPELSYDLLIKPEYFAVEALLSRARLFPLILHDVFLFLSGDLRDENLKRVMLGYYRALERLEKEKVIMRFNRYYKVAPEFIDKVKSRRTRFINLFKSAQRALFL
ncbi:hypothetical protein H5T51_01885, partial [Candidatus Bathyarchaeota archaeon]|nr:hypothetical protein [Candidatus Bathyarchaeota archaeon]